MRPADFCNPHVKDEHPFIREVTPGSPEVSRAIHAPESRFRPMTASPRELVRPTQCHCHLTSDASVIDSFWKTFARHDRQPSSLPAPNP